MNSDIVAHNWLESAARNREIIFIIPRKSCILHKTIVIYEAAGNINKYFPANKFDAWNAISFTGIKETIDRLQFSVSAG